ncbi:MAG: hypothetical protein AAB328_03210, partial [candidate division NC10 bacterium]
MSALPHPPAWSLRNTVRIIGPGAVLLGISLGAGEWLLGPVVAARHGPGLLWICTASALLQALLSAEGALRSPRLPERELRREGGERSHEAARVGDD